MEQKYNVVLTGEAASGVSLESAIAALARVAGIERQQAEAMFARGNAVLKRDLAREQALAYQQRLQAMGIVVAIEPVATDGSQAGGQTESQPQSQAAVPAAGHGGGSAAAAPGAAAAAASDGGGKRHVGFVFSGSGYEYFKIWIVNILLIVLTLGLYAPWAKVRNTQYFYGNTSLEGASFQFTADPVRMLMGRLVALALLAVFIGVSELAPWLYLLMSIGLVFVVPWVINKSLAFYARNTTYRNIRFRFVGTYVRALVTFIGWPILAMLSFGILSPYALYKQQRFYAENHRYGNKSFNFTAGAGDYYVLCLVAFGLGAAGAIAGMALLPMLASLLVGESDGWAAFAGLAGGMLGYAVGLIYFLTGMKNLMFNNLTLSSHDFKASYKLGSYGLLMVTNFIFTLLTLGLFIPWAKVRLAQYAAQHTAMDVTGDLDQFATISQPDESAFGEEFGDVFDMDVAF
ncbi:hypothetical protein Maes01_01873 [Microbulbifer aestuariivivens]|uniref:DUF898 domain-containing protein n=1 Tax=Microbulbifer aestuariivivens TaxID=1908308 RepID=A0ABP9WQ26_9GAMM